MFEDSVIIKKLKSGDSDRDIINAALRQHALSPYRLRTTSCSNDSPFC